MANPGAPRDTPYPIQPSYPAGGCPEAPNPEGLIWERFLAKVAPFSRSAKPIHGALHSAADIQRIINHSNLYGEITMTATVGQPAPDFTLISSKMEETTLASQRGKTVMLLFVPFAFTPT